MGRKFSLDFKTKVVNYALLNGEKFAARRFCVCPKIIRDWKFLLKANEEITQSQNISETSRYTEDFKLNVIKHAKENGINAATQKYKVLSHYIQKWLSWEEIENNLASWITEQQKNGVMVKQGMVKNKALEMFKTEYSGDQKKFKASYTWVRAFMKRKKLSYDTSLISNSESFHKIKEKNQEELDKSVLSHSNSLNDNNLSNGNNYSKLSVKNNTSIETFCNTSKVKTEKISKKVKRLSSNKSNSMEFDDLSKSDNTPYLKLGDVKNVEKTNIFTAARKYNVSLNTVPDLCNGQRLENDIKQKIKSKNCVNSDHSLDVNKNQVKNGIENDFDSWVNEQYITKEKIKNLELINSKNKVSVCDQKFLKSDNLNIKNNITSCLQEITQNKLIVKTKHLTFDAQKSDESGHTNLPISDTDTDLQTVKTSKRKPSNEDKQFKKIKLENCAWQPGQNVIACTSIVNKNDSLVKIIEKSILKKALNKSSKDQVSTKLTDTLSQNSLASNPKDQVSAKNTDSLSQNSLASNPNQEQTLEQSQNQELDKLNDLSHQNFEYKTISQNLKSDLINKNQVSISL